LRKFLLIRNPSTRKVLLDLIKKGYNKIMQILKRRKQSPVADAAAMEKKENEE